MAKRVVAAIKIIHNGVDYEVGKPLDTSKFTKEDLTRLYERGAVKIVNPEEVEKEEARIEDETTDQNPGLVAPPSVPSEEDERRAETEKAEARSEMAKKENDPNANK